MTEQLYNQDCYIRTFQATVMDCQPDKAYYKVVLDRTAFFPEGGGQTGDTGFMRCPEVVNVLDVKEKNGEIYHLVDQEIEKGTLVEGELNWEERFFKMQHHTGEHIVSGLIHRMYGYHNVGFHLGNQNVTMDFDGVLTRKQVDELEVEVNKAVTSNIQVKINYPSENELTKIAYRSKIEIEGQVRIVEIPQYDVCACCAPHVKKTGEIGLVKIVDIQSHRGGVRMKLACGHEALCDYQVKSCQTKKISGLLSAKEDEVYDAVCNMKEELIMTKQSSVQLQRSLISYKMKEIDLDKKCIILFEEQLEVEYIRELVNIMVKKGIELVVAFKGNDLDGYHYTIGSETVDVRSIGKILNQFCNGKGGGKPMMVQGNLQDTKANIMETLKEIKNGKSTT